MPGPVLHVGAVVNCPHGVPSQVVPGSPRVLLSGTPAATMVDQFPVAGCPFTLPGGKPSPCVLIKWLVPAVRVTVMGSPVVLATSTGFGVSPEQAPQGPPIPASFQTRVVAT
ncbi:MAG TPA: hypothetical protein VFO65_02800 [Acidimicrobiales bacterium]|nr:hypothetical protein [Acidimicrobiales bacterium]